MTEHSSPAPAVGSVTLQPADLAHVDVLSALHGACFDEPWPRSAFSALMSVPGTVARVAMIGDTPVGFALLRAAAGEAEVLTFGVDPRHRRCGVGSQLLSDAANIVRGLGALELYLEVAATNPAAIALYEQSGFSVAGRRAGYYAARKTGDAPVDAIVLKLDLT